MKKLLSVLLALVLLLSSFCIFTLSTTAASPESDFEYRCLDDGVYIDKYVGPGGDVVIPETINGYPVVSIGHYFDGEDWYYGAFDGCTKVTSIVIPKTVKWISGYDPNDDDDVFTEGGVFRGCTNLTEIVLLGEETTIGTNAFRGTGYYADPYNWEDGALYIGGYLIDTKSQPIITIKPGTHTICEGSFDSSRVSIVHIPDSVRTIKESAFKYCNRLLSVTIPDGVTTIEEYAFYGCGKLRTVSIGKNVKSIDVTAFRKCQKLEAFIVSEDNAVYSSNDGVLFSKDRSTLIQFPAGKSGSYTVPDEVRTIGWPAFSDCENLTAIAFSDKITAIGINRFQGCVNLTDVVFGKNISFVDKQAFFGCENLKNIWYLGASADREKMTINDTVVSDARWYYDVKCTNVEEPGCIYAGWMSYWCSEYIHGVEIDISPTEMHTYDNTCDKSCNICGVSRTVKHKYTNACDTTCNTCKATRKITHKYETVTKKATTTANGYTVKRCSVCKKETGKTTIYKANKVTLSKTAYTYNGKAQKPSVVIKDSKGNKIASSNYTITYASGRKNVGTYKVTIKFKGKYSGTKTLTYKINPVKTTVSKLTAAKKSLKVTITKKTTQVTGYEVQYSTSKNFTSAKAKTLTSYKKNTLTLSNLTAKKTYYVRVRTYKTVGGKKYYSGWSTVKSLKTK